MLCEGHNNGLTRLDEMAGVLMKNLDAVDKYPDSMEPMVQLQGPLIERWFLKVVCGLIAGQRTSNGFIPDQWKSCLMGGEWPEGWGMYCDHSSDEYIFVKDVHIQAFTHPETKRVLVAQFYFGGVCFNLLLGKPDPPRAFGMYRPRGFIFTIPQGERRIEFLWPFITDEALYFTRVGTTSDVPPYRSDWKRNA
jgi:hypothetical protein